MNRKAQVAFGVLVVLAGVGIYYMVARRAETKEIERVLVAADTIGAEFEACVVEGAAPPDYGQAITDRLLLDRGYQDRFLACVDTHEAALGALIDSVKIRREPDSIADLRYRRERRRAFFNPERAAICGALARQRRYRADLLKILGRTDAAPAAMDCPQLEDYEVRKITRHAVPESPSGKAWRVEYLLANVLFATHGGTSEQPARIIASTLDSVTSVELPAHIESALESVLGLNQGVLRWGSRGPVAVVRPDHTERYPSKPYQIERWSEGFEPRPAPRGMGRPEELWLTPERWFLASIGDDRRIPSDLTIHISDDEGEHFRSLVPPNLPSLPGLTRFRLMGHADGSELLVLAARATSSERFKPTFHAPYGELQFAVVRIGAAGQISSSAVVFEHPATPHRRVELQACSTDGGAIAVLDGETVVVVEGLEARLVHSFVAGEELDVIRLALACHGGQAVLLARRRIEPEPFESISTGVKSAGGPLHRFVCDADGCDAGEVVTNWASHWDLRPTATGVRALVDLHLGPASFVYLIDEPPGGPLEARFELYHGSPIDGIGAVYDGVTFALEYERRWGWF